MNKGKWLNRTERTLVVIAAGALVVSFLVFVWVVITAIAAGGADLGPARRGQRHGPSSASGLAASWPGHRLTQAPGRRDDAGAALRILAVSLHRP